MGNTAGRALATLGLSLALGLISLWGMNARVSHTLTLADFAPEQQLLLSCYESDSTRGDKELEPMWCTDSDTPYCLPALPPHPAPELWDGFVASLPFPVAMPSLQGRTVGAQGARPDTLLPQLIVARIERPPRA